MYEQSITVNPIARDYFADPGLLSNLRALIGLPQAAADDIQTLLRKVGQIEQSKFSSQWASRIHQFLTASHLSLQDQESFISDIEKIFCENQIDKNFPLTSEECLISLKNTLANKKSYVSGFFSNISAWMSWASSAESSAPYNIKKLNTHALQKMQELKLDLDEKEKILHYVLAFNNRATLGNMREFALALERYVFDRRNDFSKEEQIAILNLAGFRAYFTLHPDFFTTESNQRRVELLLNIGGALDKAIKLYNVYRIKTNTDDAPKTYHYKSFILLKELLTYMREKQIPTSIQSNILSEINFDGPLPSVEQMNEALMLAQKVYAVDKFADKQNCLFQLVLFVRGKDYKAIHQINAMLFDIAGFNIQNQDIWGMTLHANTILLVFDAIILAKRIKKMLDYSATEEYLSLKNNTHSDHLIFKIVKLANMLKVIDAAAQASIWKIVGFEEIPNEKLIKQVNNFFNLMQNDNVIADEKKPALINLIL